MWQYAAYVARLGTLINIFVYYLHIVLADCSSVGPNVLVLLLNKIESYRTKTTVGTV